MAGQKENRDIKKREREREMLILKKCEANKSG
jgi:hypothetical protein